MWKVEWKKGVREEEDENEGVGGDHIKTTYQPPTDPFAVPGCESERRPRTLCPLAGPPPPPPPSLGVGAYRRLAALLKPFSLGPK